ncbi:MAG TPA: 30S ribosomal protein S5 [Actinomycetota bacterium]|nr:30S ribosomal protein S5 [Actinomycetota bacterium]
MVQGAAGGQGGGGQGGGGGRGQGRGGPGGGRGQGRGGPGGGRGGPGGGRRDRDRDLDPGLPQLEQRVLPINRVSKVVKGGRRFSFAAMVVVGDRKGKVGIGYGKAKEVPMAIQKAEEIARRSMFSVPMVGSSIPHEVLGQDGAGKVLLKPAAPGTGIIAGGAVRAVMECAGIQDVLSKSLGSGNRLNIVHATIAGLRALRSPDDVAAARGRSLSEVTPAAMLETYKNSKVKLS